MEGLKPESGSATPGSASAFHVVDRLSSARAIPNFQWNWGRT
jgi:hypothetical protein